MIIIVIFIVVGIMLMQVWIFVDVFVNVVQCFGIIIVLCVVGWISQCVYESIGFVYFEESLYYMMLECICVMWFICVLSLGDVVKLLCNLQVLVNCVYSNCNGNGDEFSGDGWIYWGWGLLQFIGWVNYLVVQVVINEFYKVNFDLVVQLQYVVMIVGWFWIVVGCNVMVDNFDVDVMIKVINGLVMVGFVECCQFFECVMCVFF